MDIRSIVADLIGGSSSLLKSNLSSYCDIETAKDNIIIYRDGSLGTVFRFDGYTALMGSEDLGNIVEVLNERLAPSFQMAGQSLEFSFTRNPEQSAKLVSDTLLTARSVAQRQNLGLEDLINEDEAFLPRYIVYEGVYIVAKTRPAVLHKDDLETSKKETQIPTGKSFPKWVRDRLLDSNLDIQNTFIAAETLVMRHESFVSMLKEECGQLGLIVKDLHGSDAIKAIHEDIYPDQTGSQWRPYLPGDKTRKESSSAFNGVPRQGWVRPNKKNDLSYLLWPKLPEQLFTEDAEYIDGNIIRVGNNYVATAHVTKGPQTLHSFRHLLYKVRDGGRDMPWKVSFRIDGDGMGAFRLKSLLAAIVSFTNKSTNVPIMRELEGLQKYKDADNPVVKIRISLATWSPVSAGRRAIEKRSNILMRAIEAWGYCQATTSVGDPLAGYMSTALGLSHSSVAPVGGAPLDQVLYMLPFDREASPFTTGSTTFRTPDKRMWPYQMGSNMQNAFVDIIYATPGKGKSVLMNTLNLNFILSASSISTGGPAKLPLVRILDIGPSSAGLISLLKDALPPDRRHEAVFKQLQMRREDAINIFDTPLGCRYPLKMDRNFIKNFLTQLGTPEGEDNAPPYLSDIIGMMIDAIYKYYSDQEKRGAQPRQYRPVDCPAVDEALAKYNITPPATWWGCVDALYAVGDIHMAGVAQRYAVPRLEDFISFESKPVQDMYGEATLPGTPLKLIQAFRMMVSSAVNEYPNLVGPTQFDLGDAKVVAMDLSAVAPTGGGEAGDKQCALMYLLGRFVLTSEFYHSEKILSEFNAEYLGYHQERIKHIRETPKRINFDEFHRTSKATGVRVQIREDMREGRKWDVQIVLASQLLSDFDEDMISLTTGFWLLGVQTKSDVDKAAETFSLSKVARNVLAKQLTGPKQDGSGSPLLLILAMKDQSRHEHLLVNTLGPQKSWAFSTTSWDVALRNRLYAALGPQEARRRLAARFPGGSAKREIEVRNQIKAERGVEDLEGDEGTIDEIARELITLAAD